MFDQEEKGSGGEIISGGDSGAKVGIAEAVPPNSAPEEGNPLDSLKFKRLSKKEKLDFQTTKAERFTFPLYGMGQNMVLTFVSTRLMLFYTDHLHLPPYVISVIMLIAKIWDGVNDPLFGYVADRTSFKKGKFLPWLKLSSLLIPAATLLIFLVPASLSLPVKIAMVSLTYMFWDMAYTVSDVPMLSSLTAMTGNTNERATIIGYNGISGVPATLILNGLLVPNIDDWGFPTVAAVLCAIALVSLIWLPYIGKERNREHIEVKSDNGGFREMFTYVKSNKYLLNFLLIMITFGSFNIPMGDYIMIQYFGSLDPMATIALIGLPFTLLIPLLVPVLIRKVEKITVFRVAYLIPVSLSIVSYFIGKNSVIIYGLLFILRSLFYLTAVMLLLTFCTDYVEYGHYKTGLRREAITFSLQTFSTKFTSAISTSFGALVLGWIKYDGALKVQSPETVDLIWKAGHLIPLIGLLLVIPLVWRCNLWAKDAQIMADVNAGRLSREEGEAQLRGKY